MKPITFGSVCSGIEAASVAWNPLGWKAAWLSEIEPWPCQLLAHHYPNVPNLGNMLDIPRMLRNGTLTAPDVFTGGTPCQAFSIAGLRQSLGDARGNLSLTFCEIADEIDIQRAATGLLPCVIKWENVLGVLTTEDNAFGCFLAGLAGEDEALVPEPCPAAGKSSRYWRWNKKSGKHALSWSKSGCVIGPQRAVAWRVLDAQYFGVAQRRRRVFVVASARAGFDPAAVLLEFDGVRRDSPPSRGPQEDTAGTVTSSLGRLGGQPDCGSTPGFLQPVECFGGGQYSGARTTAATLKAHAARIDFEGDNFLVQPVAATLDASYGRLQGCSGQDATHGHSHLVPVQSVALRGREGGATAELGDDLANCLRASSGGGDKPHVLAPIAFDARQDCVRSTEVFGALGSSSPQAQAVAFSCKDYGADATVELAPTLHAMNHAESHQNGGGQMAVCVTGDITHTLKAEGFDASEDGTGRGQPIVTAFKSGQSEAAGGVFLTEEFAPTLQAGNNGSTAVPSIQYGMAVRRLTPRECERLQGFPSMRETVTVEVCLDHQKNSAHVALSCHRLPLDAWDVAAPKLPPFANAAANLSPTSQVGHAPLVALSVRANYADELLAIRSHGRPSWSVNAVGASGLSHQPTPTAATAAALVRHGRELALEIRTGKAGSPASTRLSIPANRGGKPVQQSGAASAEYASDASNDVQPAKFTMSELGRLAPQDGSTLATSLCSVLAAISSCIPNEILPASFSLQLEIESDYTLVPVRGKLSADGPRYKALGNSWAVPKVRWIGRRIDAQLRQLSSTPSGKKAA